jgi:DNA-binding transcriptional LysR family regulator
MDLRQLTFFVTIADEGGVRAAARRLHISQPQVSDALRRLERELGVELVTRSAQGSELTDAGREFLAHSRDLLSRLRNAQAAMQRIADRYAETLRVGVCPGTVSAGELLSPILTGFQSAHPEITLELEDLTYHGQTHRLVDGTIDVAIVRAPLAHRELTLVPVATEPRIVMVGARHELASETSLDIEDILGYPTLPIEAGAEYSAYWQLDDFRGGTNRDAAIRPVRGIAEGQLRLATRELIVTSPSSLARFAPNPLTRMIPLIGASPSVIAVAYTKRPRRAVHDFVAVAQAMAESNIDVLPGGALPV